MTITDRDVHQAVVTLLEKALEAKALDLFAEGIGERHVSQARCLGEAYATLFDKIWNHVKESVG